MSAYFPPITAAARIGSVGVKQAPTARDERKDNPGIREYINPAETNHPWTCYIVSIDRVKGRLGTDIGHSGHQ